MTVNLSLFAGAGWQFFDNSGVPLAGGLLYTYAAGTTTPLTTYTSNIANVANSNPIVLNSAGRLDNEIWLTQGSSYKFILKDSNNVLIGTYDNIFGANDQTALNTFITTLAGPTGSSLVGYNEGDGGAVTRTVQSKFQESISVKDFGAKGDGITNDSVACQNAWNAIAAQGGGTLYFPTGTYLINITGTGLDGVSIRGEGIGTTICSYANNKFAVSYDTGFPTGCLFIQDIGFIDSTRSQTKHGVYCNMGALGISFQNVRFDGLGIGLCSNSTFGYNLDSCKFTYNYCSIFNTTSTGANTSITNINGQTVTITDAFFPISNNGIWLLTNCTIGGKIGFYQETPNATEKFGAALTFIRCTFVPESGCSFSILNQGWSFQPSFYSCWFEGTLGSVAIRAITLPAAYLQTNNTNILCKDTFISQGVISGNAVVTLENCTGNNESSWTISDQAAIVCNGFQGDGLGSYQLPFYAENVQNVFAERAVTFYTTPKIAQCNAYNSYLVSSNACLSGNTLFGSYGATTTHVTSDSVFLPVESFQVVNPSSGGTIGAIVTGTITLDPAKIYVGSIALKSISGGTTYTLQGAGTGALRAAFTVPNSKFQTFGFVTTTAKSGTDQLILTGAASATWLVSGFQLFAFDNYGQATQFLASSVFNGA
jgi:hypothetical protein